MHTWWLSDARPLAVRSIVTLLDQLLFDLQKRLQVQK